MLAMLNWVRGSTYYISLSCMKSTGRKASRGCPHAARHGAMFDMWIVHPLACQLNVGSMDSSTSGLKQVVRDSTLKGLKPTISSLTFAGLTPKSLVKPAANNVLKVSPMVRAQLELIVNSLLSCRGSEPNMMTFFDPPCPAVAPAHTD